MLVKLTHTIMWHRVIVANSVPRDIYFLCFTLDGLIFIYRHLFDVYTVYLHTCSSCIFCTFPFCKDMPQFCLSIYIYIYIYTQHTHIAQLHQPTSQRLVTLSREKVITLSSALSPLVTDRLAYLFTGVFGGRAADVDTGRIPHPHGQWCMWKVVVYYSSLFGQYENKDDMLAIDCEWLWKYHVWLFLFLCFASVLWKCFSRNADVRVFPQPSP